MIPATWQWLRQGHATLEFLLEAADGTGHGIVATHPTQPGQMVTWLLWQACGDLASTTYVCGGRFPPGHQPALSLRCCLLPCTRELPPGKRGVPACAQLSL